MFSGSLDILLALCPPPPPPPHAYSMWLRRSQGSVELSFYSAFYTKPISLLNHIATYWMVTVYYAVSQNDWRYDCLYNRHTSSWSLYLYTITVVCTCLLQSYCGTAMYHTLEYTEVMTPTRWVATQYIIALSGTPISILDGVLLIIKGTELSFSVAK